jgi:predicted ATPase
MTDTFFGRAAERAHIEAAWAAGARFVTLVGPPGAGKTRLARALGGDPPGSAAHPPAAFVDLVAARDAADVFRALAAALAIPLGDDAVEVASARIAQGLAAYTQQLADARSSRHTLGTDHPWIILDNLEQLPDLAPWIEQWPRVRWLGTSRRPLGVVGEVVVPVGGLPTDDAVALFRARAWAAGVVLPDTSAVTTQVTALVLALDGLPLALELAAARTPLLSVAELHHAVGADPGILQRSGGGRHAGLAAALATSWALLTEAQATTLRKLTVFRAPAALDAVAGVLGVPPAAALDALESLRATSWLRVEPGPPTRYRLYVGVRAFVRAASAAEGRGNPSDSHLFSAADAPDPDAVRRHAQWHGAEGERLWWALRKADPRAALDALAALAEDLRAALDAAVRLHLPAAAAGAALGLHALTGDRGPWHAGTAVLDTALAIQPADAPERVLLWSARALTLALRGAYRAAAADAEAARAVARRIEHMLLVLGILGPIHRFEGHIEAALALARQEGELARAHGRDAWAARADFNLANALLVQGHRAQAEPLWRSARATALAHGEVRIAAICLTNQAIAAAEAGHFDDARALFDAAAAELVAAEMPVIHAKLTAQRARLALAQNTLPEAAEHIAAGRAAAARLCDAELAVDIEVAAARLAERRDDPAAAHLWASARTLAGDGLRMRLPTEIPGRWLVGPQGQRIDLAGKPVLRRVLAALAEGPLSVAELVERAWPGERILPDAAASRVYTAVRALRRLGAPITTGPDGGYALDPSRG